MHATPRVSLATLFVSLLCVLGQDAKSADFVADWSETNDRVWVGADFWANRLQDWRVNKGRLECIERRPRYKMRTVHLLTHELVAGDGNLEISVRSGLIDDGAVGPNAATGLLLGAGSGEMDYRAAAIVHNSAGSGGGIFVGADGQGRAFIRDFEKVDNDPGLEIGGASARDNVLKDVTIRVLGSVAPNKPGSYIIRVSVHESESNARLSFTVREFPIERIVGNIALVSHPGPAPKTARFWFRELNLVGSRIAAYPDRTAGPILGTQYTLSRGILKMTAQLMPIGVKDPQSAALQTRREGDWQTIATAGIVVPGWTATFRVGDWPVDKDVEYRVVYGDRDWSGTVRRDPSDKETIVVAGFTGNHNNRHGLERGRFNWKTGMWFPHHDLTEQVAKHKPDVLFFSGDQVYEGNSPTHPDRANIKLDYLYKWYMWLWSYRDLTKDIPAVTIPDDHDVYQGNLWGEGGRKTDKDDKGGYVHPADFVKMSERTQTSHLPDPFDPTPLAQGIGSYYTDMVYGRISFAVLEDRKFKSGCNGRVPPSGSKRADHITDPDFDVTRADVAGLELLGKRQEEFLQQWGRDWRGSDMKVALSQTVFANLATHHGPQLQYLRTDLDSNGWPQSGRNRALDLLRRCYAFHIGGDQHLATIVHHGIDTWEDAGWSFVVPSVANFYPRAFAPKNKGEYAFPELEDYTGRYRDGLMNYVTVHAATNPGRPMGHEPADLHDRMPGYGIVKLNKSTRKITMECWPRFADPDNPDHKPYPGWPKTIHQGDNYPREPVAHLHKFWCEIKNPVVQVISDATGEVVYTKRIHRGGIRPGVFAEGTYTVIISDPDTGLSQTITGIEATTEQQVRQAELPSIKEDVVTRLKAAQQETDDVHFWPELRPSVGNALQSNNRVFVRLDRVPTDRRVAIPRLNNRMKRVYLLSDVQKDLEFWPEPHSWVVTLPEGVGSEPLPIVVIETLEPPHLPDVPQVVGASDEGDLTLSAHAAVTYGTHLRYEPQPHKNTVGYWTNANDYARWHVNVAEAGEYTFEILQGCGKGHGGSTVAIFVQPLAIGSELLPPSGDPQLTFTVEDTGHFQNFVPRELGKVSFPAPGIYTLDVRPLKLAKAAVMDVRQINLSQVD